ncbi:serine hydrolase domain-containing protein [Sandaracinobacteroides hominis]|uniref:serine hydrolase domain-containing protein n=1 Tax=Sandaracinobacteroides hominis TaxID=2780086 RepID=UPI001F41BFFE|nr:serine hydrolase domain-containing protein [Sandaracinobacteroides hominis]
MRFLALGLAALSLSVPAIAQSELDPSLPEIRKGFEEWKAANHVPGLVWGVVKDGTLIHVEGLGVQDIVANRPVTADSRFRIASMSKAFTAYGVLRLQEAGKLRLDDPAATYVPEMAGWGAGITVEQLMHHMAGFVTDDPWGDRQQVLTPAEFTAKLKAGVPFQSAPGTRYEYSNFGYATLGRVITNVSGKPYQRFVGETVFTPLGMGATTYDVKAVPRDRLAQGYRWENGQWSLEPEMRDGEFGAMGGVVTTANDYAKWVAHLLSGWPVAAKVGADGAVLRAMRAGGGLPHGRARPGKDAADCRLQFIYAGGLVSGTDCLLGPVMFYSGGYPGYGSHMLLLPEAGVGIFAFSNRTYAAPLPPVWDAAGVLSRAGVIQARPVPLTPMLAEGYATARQVWAEGRIDVQPERLAMNMLLDRSARNWAAELTRLKAASGACDTAVPVVPDGAMSGRFSWTCEKGRISGQILLAPTNSTRIQALRLSAQ